METGRISPTGTSLSEGKGVGSREAETALLKLVLHVIFMNMGICI